MGSSEHISDGESEGEECNEGEGSSLSSRNGRKWFARMSNNLEGLVFGWMNGLETFFLQTQSEVGHYF
jgi:hypothetical protein